MNEYIIQLNHEIQCVEDEPNNIGSTIDFNDERLVFIYNPYLYSMDLDVKQVGNNKESDQLYAIFYNHLSDYMANIDSDGKEVLIFSVATNDKVFKAEKYLYSVTIQWEGRFSPIILISKYKLNNTEIGLIDEMIFEDKVFHLEIIETIQTIKDKLYLRRVALLNAHCLTFCSVFKSNFVIPIYCSKLENVEASDVGVNGIPTMEQSTFVDNISLSLIEVSFPYIAIIYTRQPICESTFENLILHKNGQHDKTDYDVRKYLKDRTDTLLWKNYLTDEQKKKVEDESGADAQLLSKFKQIVLGKSISNDLEIGLGD